MLYIYCCRTRSIIIVRRIQFCTHSIIEAYGSPAVLSEIGTWYIVYTTPCTLLSTAVLLLCCESVTSTDQFTSHYDNTTSTIIAVYTCIYILYVYIHVRVYTCTYICVYTYIHVYRYIHVYTCIQCTCIYVCACMCIYIYIYTHICNVIPCCGHLSLIQCSCVFSPMHSVLLFINLAFSVFLMHTEASFNNW